MALGYSSVEGGTHPLPAEAHSCPLSMTSLVGMLTMPLSLPWAASGHGPRAKGSHLARFFGQLLGD